MLVVLDTNILISALLVQASPPAKLIELWRNGRFKNNNRGQTTFNPAHNS